MTVSFLAANAPTCRSEEDLCEFVWKTTHNSGLADSAHWALAIPGRILFIIVGALIARWLAHRIINRITQAGTREQTSTRFRPLTRRVPESFRTSVSDISGFSQRRIQRAQTLGSVLKNVVSIAIFTIVLLLVLAELGLNVAPLLASAGILGIALGFGAQNIVRDFLSGTFMILEDQYGVGDYIDLGTVTGTVETIGMRTTRLRDDNGVIWYVRNGEINKVGNRSQNSAEIQVEIPLPYGTNLSLAEEVITKTLQGISHNIEWKPYLLSDPRITGLDSFTLEAMILTIHSQVETSHRIELARHVRRVVTEDLQASGIGVGKPLPTDTV